MLSTGSSIETQQRVARWLPVVIFLLIAAGTLGPGSYFLHIDTPTQHVAAWDLLNGCWGYTAATLFPFTLLLIPYALFGLNPLWEAAILAVLGAVMAWAMFRLVERASGSRRWALLGALWFITLPTVLYYTRMHIGYALVFFTLGLLLHSEERYLVAGLAFGLTLTSHFNTLVPLGLWAIWTFILDRNTRRFKNLLRLGVGFLAPLLLLETVRWLYLGVPFGWVRNVVTDALRLSEGTFDEQAHWPVWHLIHWISFANGPVNALVLIVSLLYPLVRNPHQRLMDATFAAGWSLLAFYSIRISLLGNTFLTPRMVATAYPLLALTSIVTLQRLWSLATDSLQGNPRHLLRAAGALVLVIGLPVSILKSALDAAAGSQTAFDALDAAVAQAAVDDLPVRYAGYFPAGLAFGQRHGVPVAINETDPDILAADGRSVRIVQSIPPDEVDSTLLEQTLNPDRYQRSIVPQAALWRPALLESYGMSPERLREWAPVSAGHRVDAYHPVAVIYWPDQPQGEFVGRDDPEGLVFYYPGSGCYMPLPIGEGEDAINYYVILGEKARTTWSLLRQGQVGEAARRLWDALLH